MQFLQYVLTFVVFIVCLSILIMIHELGHLMTAKMFNVYCFDYSIGFGPTLFHKKRKNGETYFSIRAIPFGGFVSMYGEQDEGAELPDGIKSIPPERSLNNIKPWKRAIVLVAGVTLNALLSIVLLIVSNSLPKQLLYLHSVDVLENSVAATAGLTSNDLLYFEEPKVYKEDEIVGDIKDYILINKKEKTYYFKNDEAYIALTNDYFILSKDSTVTYINDNIAQIAVILDASQDSKLSFRNRSYDDILLYYYLDNDGKINYAKEVDFALDGVKTLTTNVQTITYDENDEPIPSGNIISLNLKYEDNKLESYGVKMSLFTQQYNFGQAIQHAFIDFGNASGLIFRTVGGLFIGRGWNQVGGIVALYVQSSSIFLNYNASTFIYLWAVISVNLAIVNLFPFPGLDGWQLLVLFVEKVFKREIPQKVKAIISTVGIIILFAFMILIVIKDVIGLF